MGHGWLEFWRTWLEPWENWWYEIGNFAEIGDCIVLDLHIKARGRGSGVPAEVTLSQVWTVRDGKIVRLAIFGSRAEALAAANAGPGAG